MKDYQSLAMITKNTDLTAEQNMLNASMGLCGEAGEVLELFKKHWFQGHGLDHDEVIDELSDVCWYVALMCDSLGITIEEVQEHNIKKLRKRYPEGFKTHDSINRRAQ